ncbi:MAG: AAA family ATPase, partial [Clostridia bacterium]|nr:AAA family ATPase [Clostridia bacterium]
RGAGLGGGNDEREQTLNQLLVEMDGFESNEGIIVLAATNRSDVLDPALMRPGRFDRQVYVHVPDVKGREGILRIHARNKPLDESVDFSVLARITTGFTGADIENMLNEAAILAARAGRPKIVMEDITEGINKVIMGPQKKSRIVTEKERKLTAYHEAGHAILAKKLSHCEEVQEVSIIPRGHAGGYTMCRPENDDMTMSFGKANDDIAMSMGGRIAEELVLKDISSGASADIQHATKVAKSMVYDWGMSKKIGFLSLGASSNVFIGRDYQSKNDFSEKLAGVADDEIMAILNDNYKRAKQILSENIDILHEMAKLLLARETIYKDEVDMIMAGKKTEEIVVIMDEKEKLQKEKEKKLKAEQAKQEKLDNFKRKIAEGENLVKMGIISSEELDKLKVDYVNFEKALNAEVEKEAELALKEEKENLSQKNENEKNPQTQEKLDDKNNGEEN